MRYSPQDKYSAALLSSRGASKKDALSPKNETPTNHAKQINASLQKHLKETAHSAKKHTLALESIKSDRSKRGAPGDQNYKTSISHNVQFRSPASTIE